MAQNYDAIVVGLGIIGSATTFQLADQGCRVLALEQFGPVHDQGSSHGETRGLLQTYFMGPSYVPLVKRAYELWSDFEQAWGEQLVTRTGGLFIGPADGLLVPATQASADSAGLAHQRFDAMEVQRRFPQFTPDSRSSALYDPTAGFLNPERTLAAHHDLARRRGAQLNFHEKVLSWTENDAGVTVDTSQGQYRATKLIICAGAWSAKLLGQQAFPVQILRKVQLWFSPAGKLSDFQADNFPFWAWEADGAICYGFPAIKGFGRGVKVAFHTGGASCPPDEVDREIHAEDIADVREFLANRIPQLAGSFAGGSVGLYDVTPDSAFVVGPVPGQENIIVASGSSGHAFKFAPAIGEAVSEIVQHGQSTQDISLFAPDRFTRDRSAGGALRRRTTPKVPAPAMFSLEGRTAIVTGASRGIGRAIARGFAEAGADVAILARSTDALAKLAEEIEKLGRQALVIPCDVGKGEQIRQAIAEILAEFGKVDIVVNNAGTIKAAGPFLDLPFDDWVETIRVNFESIIHVCQAIGPHLVERGAGSVLNISSIAGVAGVPMLSPYAATKAAIVSLTRTLATEWAASGVRVNALTPGWTGTDLTTAFFEQPQISAGLLQSVPSGQLGEPTDLVGAAIYLASDASKFVTGACLTADGGLTSYVGGPTLMGLLQLGRVATP